MKKIQEETGMSFSEALNKKSEDISIYETVLFAALKSGAFEESVELDLTREDMELALDSCFLDFMKAFSSDKFFPKEAIDQVGKSQMVRKEVKRKK